MSTFNKPRTAPKTNQQVMDEHYKAGWNSAIEMAAYRIEHDFLKSFGKDTLASIAIYIRRMKK